ncbi:beta-glucosidase-like glycosyl hydrolase [Fervidobacterium pennivorans DSM 9078]|uniref:Beta-glucosidase-like glycosyl hydrolase n=1 Tax=Fervidobacterium pennivorans (strain DSM 9078 / Ven5) TaxID=771875 RepID=H9UAN7_FERPD|nr:beta-glucosidase [Fervidobacterium pennivorans]AFG34580.1 beta-glucosidase-like glycosyl hydrolase [Fervidobacterium pennivorans DSM 9078]
MVFDIERVISEMTVDEKISFLVGVGLLSLPNNPAPRVKGAAGETRPIERLGIPGMVLADGPAGLRIDPERENDENKYHATAFPVETMLAATWNRNLLRKVGEAMGEEVKEYGVDILLAPAINIHRNPLCGRNFEYYSEDPLLTGEMAASFVEGVQSQGVGACLKHFVVNEQETNRMTVDTIVSERALREIYLKPFEIAIKKAKPWTVMSSYNKLNGKYTSQNKWLLKDVLRDEWGFDGLVMTDWFAGDNAAEQIKSWNDLLMPGNTYQIFKHRRPEIEEIKEAYERGEITDEMLNERVRTILKVLVKTPSFKGYNYSNKPNLDEHAKVSYEAGCEGVVLLKNENTLPLSPDTKIALFGTGQIETIRGGTGSGETHPRYTINFLDGAIEKGLNVDMELAEFYRKKVSDFRAKDYVITKGQWGEDIVPKLPQDFISEEDIEKYALRNDVGIFIITRISGEGVDRKLEKGDFYLADDEISIMSKLSTAFRKHGKKFVVVLNIGSPIEVESWKNLCDAILLVWQPGQEAGRIFADVISGKVNPSGKLPTTFPKRYEDVPSRSFPGEPKDNPQVVVYDEDIYVGYRYYDTFRIEPAFEFGFGLSYTTFEYSNLKLHRDGGDIVVTFEVKNTGNMVGKEVAQIYVRAPKGKIDKPYQELKGFEKTKLLEPGETQKMEIRVPVSSLASFNGHCWVVEKGEYEIRVGASSRDIRLVGKYVLD